MTGRYPITRRKLLGTACAAAGAARLPAAAQSPTSAARVPLKIGHRPTNMRMVGDLGIFREARQIQGLEGIELLVAAGSPNLRDLDVVRRYKREANRWGILLPSLAGVWDAGVSIRSDRARANLEQSIRAGEILGVSTILIAAYNQDAPDMKKEASYGPVVALLSDVAAKASRAGIVLAIESSISPADHGKLVDMVAQPNVKVYYDVENAAFYGFPGEAIPGIKLLGKERIAQVHVKNAKHLIEEPGAIDWADAFQAFNEIGYDGWYVFETQHATREQVVPDTARNIAFLQKHCRMPEA